MLLPPVGRASTTDRIIVTIFSVGLVWGGIGSASLFWLASGLGAAVPVSWTVGIIVASVAAAALRDLGIVKFPLPEARRLVPQSVFQKGRMLGTFQFGVEMGTGLRTYVSSTVPYLVVLTLVLTHPAYVMAVAAGIGFGLGRAAMLVSRTLSWDREPWDERLAALSTRLALTASVTSAVLGIWIAV